MSAASLGSTIALPAGNLVSAPASVAAIPADPRVAHARPDLLRFLVLTGQLFALLALFNFYRTEEGGFFRMMTLAFGGFVVHYWLPFAYKDLWWIALSFIGAGLLLGPMVATLVIAGGLIFYGVAAAPLTYRTRLLITLALVALLVYGRASGTTLVPWQFWPAFGAVFMFRLMIYLYDLRFAKARPGLREFCVYFFPLPNFYFLLFPVVDFQTMRRTYYQRDIHAIAQQGVEWMVRGAIQLALYRLVYHLKPSFSPLEVTSFGSLALGMVTIYLLYLRVSGQFHLIVGMLHLFGYDLPETHRKYLLASSLTDFWRRINIYWKDFMVKFVYFPVFFRLRKSGETRAQILATGAVFVATWALHSYQWFWLRGDILFTWPDSLFWAILGALVIVNLLIEQKRPTRKATTAGFQPVLALKTLGTFSFIVVLWSLWNAPSVGQWIDVVTWWKIA